MSQNKYKFLCGHFENKNLVLAIKSDEKDWYYFEERDSSIDLHQSLMTCLNGRISLLNKIQSIAITLSTDQIINYVSDGKFIFNGKELRTYMQLAGRGGTHQPNSSQKKDSKSSDDLFFAVGVTNPLNFLKEFEKCVDVRTDKDRLFKIRNFVLTDEKSEFSKYFFKGDWPSARFAFIKKYALSFTVNKKRDLSFGFDKETGLRSFVHRKIKAMTMYTSLTLENQLEMILIELPDEISNQFIVHDKLHCKKEEILEFCDSIQEFVEDLTARNITPTAHLVSDAEDTVMQDLEIFNYDPDESEASSVGSKRKPSTRGKAKGSRSVGRPRKILRRVSEDSEISEVGSTASSVSQF